MPRFIPFLVLALAIVGTRVPKPVEPIRGDGRWFVDATREHLELRYGSSDDGDWDDWILVAGGSACDASLRHCNSCCPMTDREDAETREAVGPPESRLRPRRARRVRPLAFRHVLHDDTGQHVLPGELGLDPSRVESGRPEDAIVGEQIVGRNVQTPLVASDLRAAFACERGLVTLNFASWNRVVPWLRAVDELWRAA